MVCPTLYDRGLYTVGQTPQKENQNGNIPFWLLIGWLYDIIMMSTPIFSFSSYARRLWSYLCRRSLKWEKTKWPMLGSALLLDIKTSCSIDQYIYKHYSHHNRAINKCSSKHLWEKVRILIMIDYFWTNLPYYQMNLMSDAKNKSWQVSSWIGVH